MYIRLKKRNIEINLKGKKKYSLNITRLVVSISSKAKRQTMLDCYTEMKVSFYNIDFFKSFHPSTAINFIQSSFAAILKMQTALHKSSTSFFFPVSVLKEMVLYYSEAYKDRGRDAMNLIRGNTCQNSFPVYTY